MDPTQDRDSPEAVIRRYSDMVYRLAFARTGNRSDAEDLYQEVFLRYLTRAPAFTSEDHRKAWLLRVAVNCANRFHTAPWRKRTEPLSEALSVPAYSGLENVPFSGAAHGRSSDLGPFLELSPAAPSLCVQTRLLPGHCRGI